MLSISQYFRSTQCTPFYIQPPRLSGHDLKYSERFACKYIFSPLTFDIFLRLCLVCNLEQFAGTNIGL